MSVHPVPSAFEARTNATYEALLWALSRPGLIRDLPEQGQAQIVQALIDRECAVSCSDPGIEAVAARAGAAIVGPDAADHAFVGPLGSNDILRDLRQGSDLYPDEGATLVCDAKIGTGDPLKFTGPGCDGAVKIAIGGLPHGFWAERAQVMRYPMGFELFLVDGAKVIGIPRSTKVEGL